MTDLKAFFEEHPRVAVAFSGGVDSAFLLYAAKQYAKEVSAYFVKTSFQPYLELEDALILARGLNARLRVLCLDVLKDENVRSNPPERCYHCKRRLFGAIAERAAKDGFSVLLDGTNASDDEADRPGMRALKELCVLSPLRICGLTKAEVRELSREAGLFTWDKPSYSCLATRIPSGTPIERRLLDRTEAAEGFMASLGFRNFRVRTEDDGARIQLAAGQFPLFKEYRELITEELSKYYPAVAVDPEARNEH